MRAVARQARANALRWTDDDLARVRHAAGPDTLLIVISTIPPSTDWHLAPTVVVGPGVPHGYLHSPSTRRLGLVTITDIAPTVLDALGISPPDQMIGHPLRYHPGAVDLGRLRGADRAATFRESIYFPLTIAYIIFQAIIYLLAIVVASPAPAGAAEQGGPSLGRPRNRRVSDRNVLVRAVPNVGDAGAAAFLVLAAIDVALVALAGRFRRHTMSPLAWVLGATVAVLCVDVATGARLQTSALLGYSPHTAARFTGLGNTAFATLAASTVLLAAIHVQMAARRNEALAFVACLFAFVIVIDGAPALGSDVGGILTLVPVFGLTLLVLSGRKISWRALAIAGVVTAALILLAVGLDLLRPPATRTHLGRLVTEIGSDGWRPLLMTMRRKMAVNLRSYRSPWSWALLTIALYMLYVLGWTRGWHELLPAKSALRAGIVGTLAAGLVGYAANDSGVVVAAIVFVYIGPFLTVLALARERGPVVILEPERSLRLGRLVVPDDAVAVP